MNGSVRNTAKPIIVQSPAMDVTPRRIDCGRVAQGRHSEYSFTIHNRGAAGTLSADISTEEPWISVKPAKVSVEPRSSVRVLVSLDPNGNGATATDFPITLKVHAETSVTGKDQEVVLVGHLFPETRVVLDPEALQFTGPNALSRAHPVKQLVSVQRSPDGQGPCLVSRLDIESDSEEFRKSVDCRKHGSRLELTIHTANRGPGRYEGRLIVRDEDPLVTPGELPISFEIEPDAVLTVESPVRVPVVGFTGSTQITIGNSGGASLTVRPVSRDSRFRIGGTSQDGTLLIAPGARADLTLSYDFGSPLETETRTLLELWADDVASAVRCTELPVIFTPNIPEPRVDLRMPRKVGVGRKAVARLDLANPHDSPVQVRIASSQPGMKWSSMEVDLAPGQRRRVKGIFQIAPHARPAQQEAHVALEWSGDGIDRKVDLHQNFHIVKQAPRWAVAIGSAVGGIIIILLLMRLLAPPSATPQPASSQRPAMPVPAQPLVTQQSIDAAVVEAIALKKSGDYAGALRKLEPLMHGPQDSSLSFVEVYRISGWCYALQNRRDEASKCFQYVSEHAKDPAEASEARTALERLKKPPR